MRPLLPARFLQHQHVSVFSQSPQCSSLHPTRVSLCAKCFPFVKKGTHIFLVPHAPGRGRLGRQDTRAPNSSTNCKCALWVWSCRGRWSPARARLGAREPHIPPHEREGPPAEWPEGGPGAAGGERQHGWLPSPMTQPLRFAQKRRIEMPSVLRRGKVAGALLLVASRLGWRAIFPGAYVRLSSL